MINTILTSIFSYNPKDWIFLLFLLILAAITVHTISWCGSVLHSVTNSGRPYAVFTFRADQDKGMSTNILMNILIPKSTQRFYIAFHLEEHPEEESPVDPLDEAMMSFGEPKSYLTFDDVRILTGLSKKELKKKLKEKQIVAMYDEDAVRQAFDEDIC